jgi:hypothetical protein
LSSIINPFTFIPPHLLLRGNVPGIYFLYPAAYWKEWHRPIRNSLNPGTDIIDEITGTSRKVEKSGHDYEY